MDYGEGADSPFPATSGFRVTELVRTGQASRVEVDVEAESLADLRAIASEADKSGISYMVIWGAASQSLYKQNDAIYEGYRPHRLPAGGLRSSQLVVF